MCKMERRLAQLPAGLAREFDGPGLSDRRIVNTGNQSWNPEAKEGAPVAVGLVFADPFRWEKRAKPDLDKSLETALGRT